MLKPEGRASAERYFSKYFKSLHMSRIGKKIIKIPVGAKVTVSDGRMLVNGPKGELSRNLHPCVNIEISADTVSVRSNDGALWGTNAAHIANMLKGVTEGFAKRLDLQGIGYRAEVSGQNLVLALGFSHPVKIPIPSDLKVTVEKSIISVSGANPECVGQFASSLVALKKPEPYKGKGIRYEGQVIKTKQGKRAAAAAA